MQAVTDDYINTAEPVGSRTVAKKYDLGVSPATIRNEMADLEESGYLEQPPMFQQGESLLRKDTASMWTLSWKRSACPKRIGYVSAQT